MSAGEKISLSEYFRNVYRCNSFVNLLDMKLSDIAPGMAELTMPVDPLKHTNLYHVAHGGALASLADTAMGVACASLGRRVVTLELNMNFIKAPNAGEGLSAVARVIHNGQKTMVVECDVYNHEKTLMIKGRGTFFVVGKFDMDDENNK